MKQTPEAKPLTWRPRPSLPWRVKVRSGLFEMWGPGAFNICQIATSHPTLEICCLYPAVQVVLFSCPIFFWSNHCEKNRSPSLSPACSAVYSRALEQSYSAAEGNGATSMPVTQSCCASAADPGGAVMLCVYLQLLHTYIHIYIYICYYHSLYTGWCPPVMFVGL